jgi:threonine/homoserine/homoserine lactone efflux protein
MLENLLPLAAVAGGSFVLALSGALVPGPMFSATLAGSHRHGFWFGPGVVLGHALAEAPVVAALLLGLSQVLQAPWLLIIIGSVGGATMALMGVGMIRRVRRPPPAMAAAVAGQETAGVRPFRLRAVLTGFTTSVLNPYWYLWWVTQPAMLLVSARANGWPGVAAFFVGHISADLVWYSAAALGVSRGRRFLDGRAYQALLVVCALILFAMAGLFLVLAAEQLLD